MPSGMQITGINSNLNTTEMVEALLSYDKLNITRLEYDQALKTSQITTLQAINVKLLAFQTSSRLLSKSTTFSSTKVTVSDEEYLTATVGKDVGLGSYTINIDALAQNHQIASQGFGEEEMNNLGTGSVQISVGDGSATTIEIDSGNNTLQGLRDAINNSSAGVTATVVNDGTDSNPYRLILTADKTGAKNEIDIQFDLTGGTTPNFSDSSFDDVETLSFSDNATSTLALGINADYTGSENKTYTFTIQGVGEQTVGQGDIEITWSDGVNSGAIIVSSADTEVTLGSGDGADGLTLQFGAGTLVAGDTFQVQSFSPLLQNAQDAKVSLGSTGGGASPITVNSESNLVTGLIEGVTLNLKKVTDGSPVTILSEVDSSKIESSINSFIDTFNAVTSALDEQFKYDPDNEHATGNLFGDRTLMMIQSSLRLKMTSRLDDLDSDYRMLADLGIRIGSDGKLSVKNHTMLADALANDLDAVKQLLTISGSSSNDKITFISARENTIATTEGYEVRITRAAKKGYLRGAYITDPAVNPIVITSENKNIQLRVNGIVSNTITLSEKTYESFSELAEELQEKILADSKIGRLGLTVEYGDAGDQGNFTINSGSYGNNSKVETMSAQANNAHQILGLSSGTVVDGYDVAGTINGEEAKGAGQILTANIDNETTAGIKLQVELTTDDVTGGVDAVISISKGLAAMVAQFADSITRSRGGTIASRTKALENQIDQIELRMEDVNERIELKRQRLIDRFLQMEAVLGQLSSQSAYLDSQLQAISANFAQMIGGKK